MRGAPAVSHPGLLLVSCVCACLGGAGGEVLTEIEREHDGDSKLGHFGDL